MFILKKYYLTVSLLLCASAALLSGCSDSDDNNGSAPPPEPEQDELSVYPGTFVFEAVDDRDLEVLVTKTADIYEATCPETWVHITPANESFFISVDPYTVDEAETAGYADRKATVTVTAGTADQETVEITQKSPVQVEYYLRTDPEMLVFEVGELTSIVEILTNAPDAAFDISTQSDWLTDIDITANVISVTVDKFIGNKDRDGEIMISVVGTELEYTLKVEQKYEEPLNLTGTWNWTAQQWVAAEYSDRSGTVNITYSTEHGFYFAEPFEDTLSGMDLPAGGVALHVDENNRVTFVQNDKLHILAEYEFIPGVWSFWFSYYNRVAYIGSSDLEKSMDSAEAGTVFDLEVSDNGTTITFPSTDTFEGTEYDLAFGFGGVEFDPGSGEEDTYMSDFGLWKDLVFKKAQ